MAEAISTFLFPVDEILQKKIWSIPEAFRYCERLAKKHYENFPVGSFLIPKKLRAHVYAIYAFARRADDFADEDFPDDERIPALEAWQDMLERTQHSPVNHPVFMALRETIREFQLPLSYFIDLITAFKMDVQVKRYASREALGYYCRHSANPVGRLILHLFGYRDEARMHHSDQICTALQLANFWQDVSVDLEKGRIYLPQNDLDRFQYSEDDLMARHSNEKFLALMKFEVESTEALMMQGAALLPQIRGRLRWELKAVVLGGLAILQKIRDFNFNTLQQRPQLQKKDGWKLMTKLLFTRLPKNSKQDSDPAPENLNSL